MKEIDDWLLEDNHSGKNGLARGDFCNFG